MMFIIKHLRSRILYLEPLCSKQQAIRRQQHNENLRLTKTTTKLNSTKHLLLTLPIAGLMTGVYFWLFDKNNKSKAENVPTKNYTNWHQEKRADLPNYAAEEVRKHATLADGIWVTYGKGVYDITEFIPKHPGSDKINMAAGSAIDPFWALYQQHNTEEILTLLESYRIGNLENVESIGDTDTNTDSPWANEPKRAAVLKVTSQQPFNAEPPLVLLREHFYTPNDIFYIRNHLPVPLIDEHTFELQIEANGATKALTYENIKKLPKYTVTAAIMCGGNRRSEMAAIKPIKGKYFQLIKKFEKKKNSK